MDPLNGIDDIRDVIIAGGVIEKVGKGLESDDAKVIDARSYSNSGLHKYTCAFPGAGL